MIVQCDTCQAKFRIDDSKVSEKGVKVKCTKCQSTFVVKPPAPPEPPNALPEIPFELEAKPETQVYKEREMTPEEKLAEEWSLSLGEEKHSVQEEPKKQDLGGFEVSGIEMQMPPAGEEFSFSFEEEEKKEPAAEKPSFTNMFESAGSGLIPQPPEKEEPVFELPTEPPPSELELPSHISEQETKTAVELPTPFPPEHAEEAHEKIDETLTAVAESAKHDRSKLIPVLAAMLIIIGFGLFYLAGGITSVSNLLNPKSPAPAGKFDIVGEKGYYIENTSMDKLFVIEGRITSTFDKSMDITGIKGSLFNSKGGLIEEKIVSPGTIVSIEDLKIISKEDMENRFKGRKKSSFPPKGSMPFMIIFSDLSTNPQEFGIELVL